MYVYRRYGTSRRSRPPGTRVPKFIKVLDLVPVRYGTGAAKFDTAMYTRLQRYGRGMGRGALQREPKTPQTTLLVSEEPGARSEMFEHVTTSADAALGDGVGIVAS